MTSSKIISFEQKRRNKEFAKLEEFKQLKLKQKKSDLEKEIYCNKQIDCQSCGKHSECSLYLYGEPEPFMERMEMEIEKLFIEDKELNWNDPTEL
jgi:hypothetical protein